MKNRQQLVNRAIKELGHIPLTTENYASINELVDGLVDSLNHRDIVYLVTPTTATASIDEELFLPLATCLAYRAAPEMGVTDLNELSYLKAKCDMAEAEMTKIKASAYTGQIAEGQYY